MPKNLPLSLYKFLLPAIITLFSLSLIPKIAFIKYLVYLILAIYALLNPNSFLHEIKSSIFLKLLLIYSTWCLISSAWSNNSIISLERGVLQLFLFLTLYRIASKGNSINAIPSAFVIILISIFSLISNIPSDSWSGGNAKGFMGFFSHQNSLGAIIIFLLPFLLLFIGQNYKKLNSSIPVIVASVSSFILFILLVMTSSRASILSFFVFIILFISLIDFKKSIRVFGTVFLIIMALQNITIISDFTHTLIFKGRDKFGESRFTVYSASIQSAKNGGLIGIGFGMSDKTNLHPEISIIKNNVICREKGSTILALIEEVGVIGLILFYLPFVWLIWKIIIQIKLNPTQIEPKFYLALIISLIIHQQFEAWGTGIGSPFFALFILYSSTALPLKKKGIKTGHSFLIPNISYGSTSP